MTEGITTEFKREYTDEIKKTVIACPYYLAVKGLRPEGGFVRQGASTVPVTGSAILKMIEETDGDDYEAARSLNQELTFQDAEHFFAEEHIPLGQEQMRTLGLVSEDGVFTNLGLLLSDQCIVYTPQSWRFSKAPARRFSRIGQSSPAPCSGRWKRCMPILTGSTGPARSFPA